MSKKSRRKKPSPPARKPSSPLAAPPARNNRRLETMLLILIAFMLLALGTTAWRFSDDVKGQSAQLEHEIRSMGSTVHDLATEVVTVRERLHSIEVTLTDDVPASGGQLHAGADEDGQDDDPEEEPLHPSEWPLEWLK